LGLRRSWCRGPVARTWRRRRFVYGQNDRAHLHLVALFDLDVLDDSRDGRRDFDGGFVRFELDDRLFFRNRVADLDQHAGDVALFDVLPQFGNLEFLHSVCAGSAAGQEIAGLALSGLMLKSLIAFWTTATSIVPSRASA